MKTSNKSKSRWVSWIAKLIILIVILILVLGVVGCAVDDGVDMALEVQEQTLSGNNAIQNYEWFKRQFKRIEALNANENEAQFELDDYIAMMGGMDNASNWSKDERKHYTYLRANVTGIRQRTNDAVAEYNARSEMANRNIFKDELPTNIFRGAKSALQFEFN